VSVIPPEIPDLGSSQLAPRQNPKFSPGPGFTTEDYFVWSRLDGRTSIREIILMIGLGIEKSIAILRKLRRIGAMLLPGEDPDAVIAGAAVEATPPRVEPGNRPALPRAPASQAAVPAPTGAIELGDLTSEEARILAEAVALQDVEKRRIIQMMRLVAGSDYFALLGVSRSADRRELKRAYFRLSKEFHPDRHYKQDLGTFGPLLNIIFENATLAFQELSDDGRRAAHIAALAAGHSDPRVTGLPGSRATGPGGVPAGRATMQGAAPLSPDGSGPIATSRTTNQGGKGSPRGSELFARACDREVAGDLAGAIRLFRAAIQLDSQPRYLRRAAKCALGFGQLKEAQIYAEKAFAMRSDDASYARLMSDVLRASGRLDEAEATLLRALDLPSTSDALMRELLSDLAAVRRTRGDEEPD
jgi:tetratricopeptide (TPR) repeat protein